MLEKNYPVYSNTVFTKKSIKIGLMGFGRIGRNIFRILSERDDIHISAISDIADHKALAYLLKYDTILGPFPHPVELVENQLIVNGNKTTMLSGKEPGDVNWSEHNVDIVIEATAKYREKKIVQQHISKGQAKKVILCVPPIDPPDKTIVMGINETTITDEDEVISNSSITAHCIAPIIQTVSQAFGVQKIFFNTIHAYTNDQRLADVPASDLRRSRAATENIIPTKTNAPEQLEALFPNLKNKIQGWALNVPVSNGSLVDLTFHIDATTTKEEVNAILTTGCAKDFPRIVDLTLDPIVSSDIKHSPYSSTIDLLSTKIINGNLVKVLAWFDNGWGYAHRVVDMIDHLRIYNHV